MRSIAAAVLVATVLLCAPAGAEAGFRYTHRISVEVELTDNWTIQNSGICAVAGSGSVRMVLSTTRSTRFRPEPQGRQVRGGRLSLAVPDVVGIKEMPRRKAKGTITTVDNTEPNPDPADAPFNLCPRDDKTVCGEHAAKGSIYVAGRGYTKLKARADLDDGFGNCRTGELRGWSNIGFPSGGFDGKGNLLLGPTSVKKMKRQRRTVLTKTENVVTHTPTPEGGVVTDDVTRRVTVTITKL